MGKLREGVIFRGCCEDYKSGNLTSSQLLFFFLKSVMFWTFRKRRLKYKVLVFQTSDQQWLKYLTPLVTNNEQSWFSPAIALGGWKGGAHHTMNTDSPGSLLQSTSQHILPALCKHPVQGAAVSLLHCHHFTLLRLPVAAAKHQLQFRFW